MASLVGRSVLITRPLREGEDPLEKAMRACGAKVIWLPALEIAPPDDLAPLDAALRGLEAFDWVAFTSQNGVEAVHARLNQLSLQWGDKPRAAAVGRKTGAALVRIGKEDVFIAPDPLASALADSLGWAVVGKRVLWPRAQVAPSLLADRLRNAGAEVTIVAAYQARSTGVDVAPLRAALAAGKVDAVAFSSARSIEATLEAIGPEAREWLAKLPRICIGPVTARACEDLGLGRPVVSHDTSLEGLVEAVAAALA
jgi:uroporphyrinogen-III synthase